MFQLTPPPRFDANTKDDEQRPAYLSDYVVSDAERAWLRREAMKNTSIQLHFLDLLEPNQ